jgi:hypothetical protein
MKNVAIFSTALLLGGMMSVAQEQPRHAIDPCTFTVLGQPAIPTVTGPSDVVPLAYVVEQPDSPLEILSVDLEGMQLSVSHENYTVRDCAKYTVRNRSDRVIQRFAVGLRVNNAEGGGIAMLPRDSSPLAPGKAKEIKSCNGGGHGGAPGNHLKLIISVESIDFGDCFYRPSLRIPRSLGITPAW